MAKRNWVFVHVFFSGVCSKCRKILGDARKESEIMLLKELTLVGYSLHNLKNSMRHCLGDAKLHVYIYSKSAV